MNSSLVGCFIDINFSSLVERRNLYKFIKGTLYAMAKNL